MTENNIYSVKYEDGVMAVLARNYAEAVCKWMKWREENVTTASGCEPDSIELVFDWDNVIQ